MVWPWQDHKQHKIQREVTVIEETEIIIVNGDTYKKHNPHDIDTIERLVKIIDRLTQQNYKLVLLENSETNKSILMALTIASNQFSLGALGLVNTATLETIAASFANQSFSSSDAGVFTASPDAGDPNTVKATGVAAGNATLNFSADASYTDANTLQSVTKSLTGTVDVTVTAVVTEEGVSLVVNFGEPQNQ